MMQKQFTALEFTRVSAKGATSTMWNSSKTRRLIVFCIAHKCGFFSAFLQSVKTAHQLVRWQTVAGLFSIMKCALWYTHSYGNSAAKPVSNRITVFGCIHTVVNVSSSLFCEYQLSNYQWIVIITVVSCYQLRLSLVNIANWVSTE